MGIFVPLSSTPGSSLLCQVLVSSGKSFIMSASAMEKTWIVTESHVAQTSGMYANSAQRDFLASVVHSYCSNLF